MGIAQAGNVVLGESHGLAWQGQPMAGLAARGAVVWRRPAQQPLLDFLVSYNPGSWGGVAATPVGIWFTVGARPVSIVSVGRYYNPADPSTSTMMDFGTNTAALITSVEIQHGTGSGFRWVWADLPTPFLATAGTTYTIRYTRDVANRWYAVTGVVVSADFIAVGASATTVIGPANEMYGLIDFRYRHAD